jgi:hypothetical protein
MAALYKKWLCCSLHENINADVGHASWYEWYLQIFACNVRWTCLIIEVHFSSFECVTSYSTSAFGRCELRSFSGNVLDEFLHDVLLDYYPGVEVSWLEMIGFQGVTLSASEICSSSVSAHLFQMKGRTHFNHPPTCSL